MGLRFRRDDARSPRPGEARSGSLLSRFARDTRAAAAVEFALVAAPFLFLLGAIFELAILFLAYQVLDTATADASRLIRTGQAQQASYTASQFKTQVCNRLYLLFDCSGVYVESVVYSNFASIPNLTSYTAYVDSSGNFDPTKVAGYNPGVGSDIVVVRVFYAYPVLFKNLLWDETSAPGGKILMTGVAVFRNEPFPWT
ncbi:MAG: pilus assembly protein [Hyphomicrobiales bacterium]|nr:pilus assembly protein [Hyphomicrobiales bacterium]